MDASWTKYVAGGQRTMWPALAALALVLLSGLMGVIIYKDFFEQKVKAQAHTSSSGVTDVGWVQIVHQGSLIGSGIPLVEYRVQIDGNAKSLIRLAYAPIGVSEEELLVRTLPSDDVANLSSVKQAYVVRYSPQETPFRDPIYVIKLRNPPEMTPW